MDNLSEINDKEKCANFWSFSRIHCLRCSVTQFGCVASSEMLVFNHTTAELRQLPSVFLYVEHTHSFALFLSAFVHAYKQRPVSMIQNKSQCRQKSQKTQHI